MISLMVVSLSSDPVSSGIETIVLNAETIPGLKPGLDIHPGRLLWAVENGILSIRPGGGFVVVPCSAGGDIHQRNSPEFIGRQQ